MSVLTCMAVGIWATILSASASTSGMTDEAKKLPATPVADSAAGKDPERTEARNGSEAAKKTEPKLIEVQRFAVTEKTLTMEYRVKNIFPQDIWVCEDTSSAGRYDGKVVLETRIINEALRINLLGNLERNVSACWRVWTRYRRLPPSQSRLQTILLTLPIANYSPVYMAEVSGARKKAVVLHQATLTVGFFTGDLPALLAQAKEKNWPFLVFRGFETLSYVPPESKDPNVAFVPQPWQGTPLLEQSAQICVTDVNIPAQVVANFKDTVEYWRARRSATEEKAGAGKASPQNSKK